LSGEIFLVKARIPADRQVDLSDIELVDRVLARAPGAFELFYRRYDRLIAHCVRARAAPADVDDICQAFFERVLAQDYRVLKSWQRGTSLPLYLAKVVRNFVIDHHRSRARREEAVGGLDELELLSAPQEESVTAGAHVRELKRLAIKAWGALNARDRRLVCDRVHRQRSNDEIAQRAQLSAGTFRTAISRAHVRMLAGLQALAPEFFQRKL
jgi:RNA polymerase sigma factor (sigma-70 family)